MRYIVYLVILFLGLTSCSEWKYSNGIGRTKRVLYAESKSSKSTVFERTEQTIAFNTELDSVFLREELIVNPSKQRVETIGDFPRVQFRKKLAQNEDNLRPHTDGISPTDSLDQEEEVDPAVVNGALDAERKGKQSRNIGIVSLVVTIVFVLFFPGFVLAIISLIKGINSLSAPYNTPEGISMARTGILLSSISLILYLLALLLVLSIILLFI